MIKNKKTRKNSRKLRQKKTKVMRGGVKKPMPTDPTKTRSFFSWFKSAAPAPAQAPDPRAAYKTLIAEQRATKAGQAYMSKTQAVGLSPKSFRDFAGQLR